MYIAVKFPTGVKSYIYFVPENTWSDIDLFDDVLVNAGDELHLAQVMDIDVAKPSFPCRPISHHFSKEDTKFFLDIGNNYENT